VGTSFPFLAWKDWEETDGAGLPVFEQIDSKEQLSAAPYIGCPGEY